MGIKGGSDDARGGRRQQVTVDQSRKTQRPSETVPTMQKILRAQEREARDRIVEGGGEAKKRKKPKRSYRLDVENGRDSDGRRKVNKKVVVQ